MNQEARHEILSSHFTPVQIKDIESSIQVIPVYDVNIKIETDGFDEVLINDVVTIKITITRPNLDKNKEIGLSHSNTNIDLYEEKASLLLLQNQKIVFEKTVKILL